MKITTRKAYASLKTFVFLRSLNVKDSKRENHKSHQFIEHTFQPRTRRVHFLPPTYGVRSQFWRHIYKYGVMLLKKREVNVCGFFFRETLNPVIQP